MIDKINDRLASLGLTITINNNCCYFLDAETGNQVGAPVENMQPDSLSLEEWFLMGSKIRAEIPTRSSLLEEAKKRAEVAVQGVFGVGMSVYSDPDNEAVVLGYRDGSCASIFAVSTQRQPALRVHFAYQTDGKIDPISEEVRYRSFLNANAAVAYAMAGVYDREIALHFAE
jgi:hypothetical protein